MSTIFRRRPSAVNCFYCQSTVHASGPSFNPSFFRCPHCGCWNRYDAHGEILSDEPAMHDERLNAESFAKRAAPNSNHLPSIYGKGNANSRSTFCHTCQTNQTLLVNLLSNYLPPPEDPSYSSRLASLPAYTSSLQTRYPPVCESCRPAVEEEIQRKETMARTRALGGALKETRAIGRVRRGEREQQRTRSRRMLLWKIQGAAWLACLGFSLLLDGASLTGYKFSIWRYPFVAFLPVFIILSLWSTSWDPTFSLVQRSKLQGRPMRVEGREAFMKLQICAWLSRLLTSFVFVCSSWNGRWAGLHRVCAIVSNAGLHLPMLIVEIGVLVASYLLIRIRQPAPVRLIDTSTSRALSREPTASSWSQKSDSPAPGPQSTAPLPPAEPDLFATLSLSNNPVITNYAANPMFGVPSLNAPGNSPQTQGTTQVADYDSDEDDNVTKPRTHDPDAMDWEPDVPTTRSSPHQQRTRNSSQRDEGIYLRQQRFFAPEQPTGLENLLMRTRLVDSDDDGRNRVSGRGLPSQTKQLHGVQEWNWCWVYTVSIIPVVGLMLVLWASYGYPLRYLR